MAGITPSPCIDICKFKRAGHCIGCSMTEAQKRAFNALGSEAARREFVLEVLEQQKRLGKYKLWPIAYERKCEMEGAEPPWR